MTALHWVTISPFLLAILIPVIYKYTKRIHTGWFVLLLPLILFIYLFSHLSEISDGNVIHHSVSWVPSLGINFDVYLDGLSMLFALLITGIGTLVILYSIYYLSKKSEKLNQFYVYMLMFMGAMLGVVLSDNLIVLYVFWEVTSVSSSLLISYWYQREKSVQGALKSMYITVFGGLSMLGGFSLIYVMAGSFSIREIIANVELITTGALFLPAMLLILLGAFTKSAQFPFHIWLPDAMEAPTPVSAYLHSATMVKAGIYLIARLTPVFGGSPEWFWIVSVAGLITLLWGSVSAVRQKDLKSILAYSTISQLGLIITLLGVGSAAIYFEGVPDELYFTAILAAVFHLINHATFKGSLFMTAGIVDHETGTRDIRRLGGLMTIMPITFTISLVGLMSMAGIPPFNGFLSKELFFTGTLNVMGYEMLDLSTWGIIFPIVAVVASIFTFLYCAILFLKTFTGKFKPENYDVKVHEAPIGMLVSPAILGTLVIIFGLFPNMLYDSIIYPVMTSILPNITEPIDYHLSLWHGFNMELFMTIVVVAAGTVLYLLMNKWSRTNFYLNERDPFNNLYDRGYDGLVKGSQAITRIQMTGLLRDYFVYMCAFFILMVGYTMIRSDAFAVDTVNISEINPFMWGLAAVFSLAVLAVPFINNRITVIVIVGVIGFMMALFFVQFRATDLALTQLLIESVQVVLFMLVFMHLPKLKKETVKPGINLVNIVISVAVGIIVTIVALSSFAMGSEAGYDTIAAFFLENAKELAGGYNVVNVVLVDFRALDTILEIVVLAIAALGVVALIKLRFTGREDV